MTKGSITHPAISLSTKILRLPNKSNSLCTRVKLIETHRAIIEMPNWRKADSISMVTESPRPREEKKITKQKVSMHSPIAEIVQDLSRSTLSSGKKQNRRPKQIHDAANRKLGKLNKNKLYIVFGAKKYSIAKISLICQNFLHFHDFLKIFS